MGIGPPISVVGLQVCPISVVVPQASMILVRQLRPLSLGLHSTSDLGHRASGTSDLGSIIPQVILHIIPLNTQAVCIELLHALTGRVVKLLHCPAGCFAISEATLQPHIGVKCDYL